MQMNVNLCRGNVSFCATCKWERNLHHCLDKQNSKHRDNFHFLDIHDSYGISDMYASCGFYEQLDSIFLYLYHGVGCSEKLQFPLFYDQTPFVCMLK
jgi:hypothetical protein